jgi:MFS family permease
MSTPQALNISPVELMKIVPFRLLWTNSFLFVLVLSTQRFAFVWLALDLGARSNINGLILFVMGIPALLISLPVGVMSDHLNRKTLLIVSQLGALATTIAIAFMVSAELMTISWAIAASFAAGIFIALGSPVRAAAIPTLVPPDKLIGAIAVNTIGMNIGLIIGPATAGPVIRIWGIQGAFWLQAVLYFLGFIALLRLELPAGVNTQRRSLRWEILEGLKFIHGHKAVRSFFVLLSASTLFMMAPWIVLGPQLAREQAGASASQTTVMFALLGVGQFVTSLFIMRFNQLLVRKGLWFMCGLCWGSGVQILLGQSTSIVVMSIFLFMWGVGGGLYMNLNQTLIQNNTPREVMGRVMAIHSLLMSGLAPAGALLVGIAARQIDSAPLMFSLCGGAMMISTLFFLIAKPHLRPMA